MEIKPFGSDIFGRTTNDYLGSRVQINKSGERLFTLSQNSDTNVLTVGLYTRDKEDWKFNISIEIRARIAIGDITINGDGTRLVVGVPIDDNAGHIEIYDVDSDFIFIKRIDGKSEGEYFGYSVALSYDGYTLAVGAINREIRGAVDIFNYNDEKMDWINNSESSLFGTVNNDHFGSVVSLNYNGTVLAVSSPTFDGTIPSEVGKITVFYLLEKTWTMMSEPIIGKYEYGDFGNSLKLSYDGNFLAVGGPYIKAGYVITYRWDGKSWIQFGDELNGVMEGENFGSSITFNRDNTLLVIGAPYHSNNQGAVYVYTINENSWERLNTLYGDTEGADFDEFGNILGGDLFGYSLTMSNDGTIFTVGASQGKEFTGYARTFTITYPSLSPPCFTSNCVFETREGLKNVDDLDVNDEIKCEDNKFFKILDIYKMAVYKNTEIVYINKDAISSNLPMATTIVTKPHMVKINGSAMKAESINRSWVHKTFVDYFYHIHVDSESYYEYAYVNGLLCDVWGNTHPYINEYKKWIKKY